MQETKLSQVGFDVLSDENKQLKLRVDKLVIENALLEEQLEDCSNNEEYINPNYEYEGIGRIYIKCDNLADQNNLENALNKIFKRL